MYVKYNLGLNARNSLKAQIRSLFHIKDTIIFFQSCMATSALISC